MEAYYVLTKTDYKIKPSEWFGIKEEELDREAERAFILAVMKLEDDRIRKENEKLKKKQKGGRR